MSQAKIKAAPRLAVLVCSPSVALARRELARHVKPNFHMRKNQWRARYRDAYPLVLLSRGLGPGQDPEALYGPHAGAAVLMLACLDEGAPGSRFADIRDWCKARGFNPVAQVSLKPGGPESETIDLCMELVNFVNLHCPWPSDEIDDLDAYLAKSDKPLW
ncbi:MAG: hypothetical protein AB9900_14220 [Humidesulfovibrio sp.]